MFPDSLFFPSSFLAAQRSEPEECSKIKHCFGTECKTYGQRERITSSRYLYWLRCGGIRIWRRTIDWPVFRLTQEGGQAHQSVASLPFFSIRLRLIHVCAIKTHFEYFSALIGVQAGTWLETNGSSSDQHSLPLFANLYRCGYRVA